MKITVELDSTYLEGSNLDEAISKKIEREVVNQIWSKVKEQAEKEISKVAEAYIKEHLNEQIISYTKTIIKTEKLSAPRYYKGDSDQISLEEYIKYMLNKDSKDKVKKAVKDFADQFTQKLKDRYDMEFATQIIHKMRHQDLLKDSVETALFESNLKDDKN